MSCFNLEDLKDILDAKNGVSFAKKSLKLDTKEDAKVVIEAIQACSTLEFLDLEGNTLGPQAAEALAATLETKGTPLKRALWKDMFTGRLKTEIPKALQSLGNALCIAKTCLVELDLSDNAFGPIGVEGLATFLTSRPCYTLKELRLNNNGLGITGGKMLAKALMDCHENSVKEGAFPLSLKVFIAGRNRLENEGAKALAAVFKKLGSLEEVAMPQNGIYHVGITALADGLSVNRKLEVLNLNDNTIGPKGANAIAKVLPNFRNLKHLDLGDCLLKTKGALFLAEALGIEGNHPLLSEVNLGYNEIGAKAAAAIAHSMVDKELLTNLQLGGNAFGTQGRVILEEAFANSNRLESLCITSDNESASESEEEEDEEDEENEEEESEEEEEDGTEETENGAATPVSQKSTPQKLTIEDFLKSPTGDKLLLLPNNNAQDFIEHAKDKTKDNNTLPGPKYLEELMSIIIKISALCGSGYVDVRVKAEDLTNSLYAELFSYATKNDQVSLLNNTLLVNLGLIKGENKNNGNSTLNLEGCFKALEKVAQKEYFLPQTRETLKIFLEKPAKISKSKTSDRFHDSKMSLKEILNRI